MSVYVLDEHAASIFSVYEYAECENCDVVIRRSGYGALSRPIGVRTAKLLGARKTVVFQSEEIWRSSGSD
jgi:hypothetical protein